MYYRTAVIVLIIGLVCCGVCFAEEIDWDRLIPAVIEIESSGNPGAYNSYSNAIGLMQITPIVFKEYNQHSWADYIIGELYHPLKNIKIGTWYLKRIWNHYLPHYGLEQNLDNLLACYNFGIGNVSKGKVWPRETVNYIFKVKRLYNK